MSTCFFILFHFNTTIDNIYINVTIVRTKTKKPIVSRDLAKSQKLAYLGPSPKTPKLLPEKLKPI